MMFINLQQTLSKKMIQQNRTAQFKNHKVFKFHKNV